MYHRLHALDNSLDNWEGDNLITCEHTIFHECFSVSEKYDLGFTQKINMNRWKESCWLECSNICKMFFHVLKLSDELLVEIRIHIYQIPENAITIKMI